jgi:hypothetical protein
MQYVRRWRLFAGLVLFIADELVLFGAAEGINKGTWMLWGSALNVLLALGFVFHGGRR